MSLSKKKLAAVDDVIRSASLSVLEERLFDAIAEFEFQATRKVREVLA